jgi:hypothetical protein
VNSTPRFPQGVFPFEGKGLDQPAPLVGTAVELWLAVPAGATATVIVDPGLVEV